MNIKLSLLITLVVCGIINATTDKTTIRDQIEKTRTQLQKNHAAAQTRHIEMSLWLNIATCVLRDQRHHEDDKKGLQRQMEGWGYVIRCACEVAKCPPNPKCFAQRRYPTHQHRIT